MRSDNVAIVTGAFGYSGGYIARRLLNTGARVRTLTNSHARHSPLSAQVEARPLCFDDDDELVESLRGGRTLYNTYWVRFNRAGFRQSVAVENTLRLFAAAKTAGIERVIHVSITNPSEDSPLAYFAGKARLERGLIESGLSYAILRPTVLFGREDILVNNIAWMLRRFPVFGVFGDGYYRLQPIYVDDLAELAVRYGESRENVVIDAIGPETFTYREMVEQIARIVGRRRPVVSVPRWVGLAIGHVIGAVVHDVVITREEIDGLMAGLLCTDSPPVGTTRLTDWARRHADTLGRHYASELARRRNRLAAYEEL